MRGLAPLFALILLLPTAGALALPVVPTPPPLTIEPPPTPVPAVVAEPPRASSPAAPIATAPTEAPAIPLDVDNLAETLPELPTLVETRSTKPDPMAGRKAERLDAAEALGTRAPVAHAPARLPRGQPGAPLPPMPPGFAWSAATPARPPSEPERTASAPREEQDPLDARAASSWRLAAGAAGLALALLAPLLYHRMRGRALVASHPRARLLEMLRERPCLSAADAARALGVDPSTALYHLRLLERERLAVLEGRHYFAAGATDASERARIVAQQHAGPILDALRSHPGATKTGLAAALAIARPTLSFHLKRLERAGLVQTVREGRAVRVFAKETLS